MTNPADLGSDAAGIVARGLLEDFKRKIPVIRAWMVYYPENEVNGLASIRRYLTAMGVTSDSEITAELRRGCLTVLGFGVSRREPYRRDIRMKIHCPQTNEKAGGCLFSLLNKLKGLFGKTRS